MKKKFTLLLCTLLAGTGLAFAAQDLFLKRLAICNPYKTVYKNPVTGESFEKAVIGVKTDSLSGNLYCVYYKQVAQGQYQLCQRRTTELRDGGPFDKKTECRYTNLAGINDAKKEVAQRNYVIDTQPAQIFVGPPQS